MRIIYSDESYQIVGAFFEVYNELGPGFLESVYHEALEKEFALREIHAVSESKINVIYKGDELKSFFYADFVVYGKIIIELKAVKELADVHRAQVHNYLKATGFELGLLVNFGQKGELVHERVVRSKKK